jgi:hypothetical protein
MSSGTRLRAAGPDVVLIVLAAFALAPVLLSRGFVLIGDMSFVPDQPWSSAWLGLDGGVPRAVPADAFVSALSSVVPGDLLQKGMLLAALVLAGLGMRRFAASVLAPRARLAPLGAAVLYLWNPWVLERLAIGHWGLLLGYAALPWVCMAAVAYRRAPGARSAAALLLPLALAAFGSPTGGILAAAVAIALGLGRARVHAGLVLIAAVLVVNLPWLLPGLLGSAQPTDPEGVSGFAARADTPFGVLGSLLSFGGIWKASIVPGERGSWFLVALAILASLTGIAFLLRGARRPRTAPVAARLLCLAILGLVLAALPTVGPGRDFVTWLVDDVPGAGILRDSQKWLALFALGTCFGVALALDAGNQALRRSNLPARAIVGILVVLPLVLLPSLAWGIAGKLDPVSYPSDWARVRAILDAQPASSRRIVVLPFSAYQAFRWNDSRAALDPAIRFFPGEVITNDSLTVGRGKVVVGEDRIATRIGEAIVAGDALAPVLAADHVRYVVIETGAAGGADAGDPSLESAGAVLYDGSQLRLLDLGAGRVTKPKGYAPVVVLGDVAAFGSAAGAGVFLTLRRIRGKWDKTG